MTSPRPRAFTRLAILAPGVGLAAALAIVSWGIAAGETRVLGHPVIEGLVVAILLGMIVRTLWTPPARAAAGVRFAAKELLEVAVVLLGVSVDLPLLVRAGPALAAGIVLVVLIGIASSYGVGRLLGLPAKLAVLVACGNAICGNSAIVAVAPMIDAEHEHVASSVAFTAILGVVMMLGLPFLMHPLGFDEYQYGVLAGLTVYSVPQVLAATFPVSALSGQVGTLVKLVRVLMLGPVVLFFALRRPSAAQVAPPGAHAAPPARRRGPSLRRLVPWFIIGFLVLATLRSLDLVPASVIPIAQTTFTALMIVSMAALGLGVDLRAVGRVGRPVVLTVSASLALLLVLSVVLIHGLGIRLS